MTHAVCSAFGVAAMSSDYRVGLRTVQNCSANSSATRAQYRAVMVQADRRAASCEATTAHTS